MSKFNPTPPYSNMPKLFEPLATATVGRKLARTFDDKGIAASLTVMSMKEVPK